MKIALKIIIYYQTCCAIKQTSQLNYVYPYVNYDTYVVKRTLFELNEPFNISFYHIGT